MSGLEIAWSISRWSKPFNGCYDKDSEDIDSADIDSGMTLTASMSKLGFCISEPFKSVLLCKVLSHRLNASRTKNL
jgi:hypothetical protein